jgi:hypothetical protein
MLAEAPQVIIDAGAIALAITGIITCVVLLSRLRIVRWFVRTLVGTPTSRWFRENVKHVIAEHYDDVIAPKVADLTSGLEYVSSELKTNGGTSIRDVVHRTDKTVHEIQKTLTHNAERLDTLERR